MCSKVKDFLTDDDFINYALQMQKKLRPYYWLRQMLPATFHWLKTKI